MPQRLAAMLFAVVGVLASANAARAQGALVHGSVAAAVADGETSPAFGGGITYRFNRALGLGVELTHVRSLESDFAYIYCCRGETDATATIFTTNVRVEIPTTSSRIIPFVVGGGGVAAVSRSFPVYYGQLAQLAPLGLSIVPGPPALETTTTSMALTLGGGASFLVSGRVAVDADLRVLHIMGGEQRNIGRFGAGVSYRF
jgi:opacity protein-like surface antigen